MQSSSTFLGFLGNTAYFRFVLLKLMVKLEYWKEKVSASKFRFNHTSRQSDTERVHLWLSHIQLVVDVFLNTGGGGSCQGHHGHLRKLLAQFVQLLVIWAEIVAPLKE